MRIIAGTKRGMNLFSPKGDLSRPITDRIKESLFNVLWNYGFPEGKIVADLFSGVGSLGLETLSRGAAFVTFVEKDPTIVAVLKKNIEKAGFLKESKVIRADAFKVGAAGSPDGRRCDLIFVDPPYRFSVEAGENSLLSGLMVLLSEQLTPDGIVVVRVEGHTELQEEYGRFRTIDKRHWGSMTITIFNQAKDDKQTGSDRDN
jgi:16S rRNA (guanine(966)-N(2))-methyltransferase RsmD